MLIDFDSAKGIQEITQNFQRKSSSIIKQITKIDYNQSRSPKTKTLV